MALATGEKQLSRDAAATANPGRLAQAKSTSIMTSPFADPSAVHCTNGAAKINLPARFLAVEKFGERQRSCMFSDASHRPQQDDRR
jgi:hypothetical protein